jgi:hypothetical protein
VISVCGTGVSQLAKRTGPGLVAAGRDRIATETALSRRVTGGVNTTVTQWSHSHAVPTTHSPVRRGANLRKEEEGNVSRRSRRGRDTVVTGTHAQETSQIQTVIPSESKLGAFVTMAL